MAQRLPMTETPLGLSPRRREVAALVAEGLTDAAIAERLSISTRTVRDTCAAIYERLDLTGLDGINPRVTLARWVWEQGRDAR